MNHLSIYSNTSPFLNPRSGLLAWWKFEEATGSTRYDMAFGRALVPVGDPVVTVQGVLGNGASLSFNTRLEIENFVDSSRDFSVSLWIKVTDGSFNGFVDTPVFYSDGANPFGSFAIGTDKDGKIFAQFFGGKILMPAAATLNAWYHLVFVRRGTVSELWVNGALFGTNTPVEAVDSSFGASGRFPTFQSNLYVGSGYYPDSGGFSPPLPPFVGAVDELAVFGYAVSAADIVRFYNGGAAQQLARAAVRKPKFWKPGSVAAWWRMDEATGTRVDEIAGKEFSEDSGPIPSGPGKFGLSADVPAGATLSVTNDFLDFSKPFTLAFWTNCAQPDTNILLNIGDGVFVFSLAQDGGNFFGTGCTTMDLTNTDFSDWQHVALTHDGSGNYQCFIGGIPTDTGTGTPADLSGATIRLGDSGNAEDFLIDQLAFWNVALTIEQINFLVKDSIGELVNPVLTAQSQGLSFTLNWALPVAGVTQFKIESSGDGVNWDDQGNVTDESTTITPPDLTPGVHNYIRVSGRDADDNLVGEYTPVVDLTPF